MNDARVRPMAGADAGIFAMWERDRPYPWERAAFERCLAPGPAVSLVLEEAGEPVAFAVANLVESEAHLINIMVAPSQRRHGWGRRMLAELTAELRRRGARSVVLDVDTANTPARALYEIAGFELLEIRRRSYPRGEDAAVMRVTL